MEMSERNALCAGLLAALILFDAGAARDQAAIEGKVTLPDPEKVAAAPPRYAGQVGEIAPADPPVAVVYLEGAFPASATNSPPGSSKVLQEGMQFRPALLPVRVGTTVSFPNGDDVYHNVFSYSKPKRFDLGRYRKEDKPATQVFDKAGVVKLYCEIHQHMRGVILVLDTPYFTRTETNGVYRLENLPPGHYVLKAWADEKRIAEKPVELVAGQTLHVDFDLKKGAH
jgi:plastocyanin